MSERRSFLGIQLPQAPEKWEPKRSLGYEKLTPAEQWTADGFSILEQKIDHAIAVGSAAIDLFVFITKILGACIILALALEGPRILKTGLEWMGFTQSVSKQP
jgi:hypothetical protein